MTARAAAVAAPVRTPAPSPKAPPRSHPGRSRPRPRAVARPRGLVAGGVVWIVALAVLLAGIVALNVAALQLNLRLDELGRERANLRAENARISLQVSSSASAPEIAELARVRLGLTQVGLNERVYVDLAPPAK
jgi:cell division protein FtsL